MSCLLNSPSFLSFFACHSTRKCLFLSFFSPTKRSGSPIEKRKKKWCRCLIINPEKHVILFGYTIICHKGKPHGLKWIKDRWSLGKLFGEILNLEREALLQQVWYSGQTLNHWIEIIKIPLFIISWKCLENKKNGRWYQS